MPLVRISLMKGKSDELRKNIGKIVHHEMVHTIIMPDKDYFQIIKENWSFGNGIAQYAL